MATLFLTPEWFFNYEVTIDLAATVIAFLVSYLSFSLYRITRQRQVKFFGIAFLLIGLSYALQFVINLALYFNFHRYLECYPLCGLEMISTWSFDLYMTLFIAGLATLVYMTLGISSSRLYSLLLVLCGLSIFMSLDSFPMFYALSAVLLLYLMYFYVLNYLEHRKSTSLIVLSAFALLFFSSIHYVFASNHLYFLILGSLLELAAMLLILLNILVVLKE